MPLLHLLISQPAVKPLNHATQRVFLRNPISEANVCQSIPIISGIFIVLELAS